MKPFHFQASTPVTTTPEALFAFHENPRNISLIAPPSLRLHEVACDERAVQGGTFRIRASQFGLPIDWTGKWEKASPPGLLVDTAVQSPFAIWRHSHIFESHPRGALLTDSVDYLLKGGLAGSLASRLVLPLVLGVIFRARHAATRRYFEGQ
ncbi:MAG: SRPBCC family protein [Terrimicrobiaceae bacterium]|jgi:hypothetical protein